MNEMVYSLLKDRYFLRNEKTWEDLAKRVSGLYPETYEYIEQKIFIPSTPTLLNANTNGERKGTLSSCFPMNIEDSIEGIFDALKEGAVVTKAGGGVGYDYSVLRSSREKVKTIDRKSSGPIPFARMFNSMLDGIQQGGVRRGAGMGLLNIYHPNILDFIKSKEDINNSHLSRMNISIKIPDSFYKDLEENPNKTHITKDITTGEEGTLKDENGKDITTIELWKKIIYLAWKVAEPGIFNETIAFDRCANTNISKTVISNPCFTGDTIVAVADGRGMISIGQLANEGKDVPVYSFSHKGKLEVKKFMNPRLTRKQADIYEVEFEGGMKIKCTNDHNLLTTSGKLIPLKDLKIGDSIKSSIKNNDIWETEEQNDLKNLNEIKNESNKNNKNNKIVKKCEECKTEFVVEHKNRHITFCSKLCMEKTLKKVFTFIPNDVHNYKIVSIKYAGKKDVYDGTVEDFHNLLIGGKEIVNKSGKKSYEFIASGNCCEFINIPYSSCNLASINLSKIIKDGHVDWALLQNVVAKGTRFLNSAIDNNMYPIEKIKEITTKIRPIGLGVMGLADMLYLLKIPYNSQEAFDLVEEISRFITLKSMETSVEMAKENGKAYDNFDHDLFIKVNKRFFDKPCRNIDLQKILSDLKEYGVYNSCFTSYAPTGSISTIAETSGGIEPVFSLLFTRRVEQLNGKYTEIYVVDKAFEQYIDENLADKKEEIYKHISSNKGSCQKCDLIPEKDRRVFVVAGDLTPVEHLNILEASANNVSLSVSKTINMPSDAKESDVEQVFLEAHKRGIIGVTVYRDGARGLGILMHSKEEKKEDVIQDAPHAPRRPKVLPCDIHHVKITKKLDKVRSFEYLVLIGLYKDGKPYEVFAVENGILDKKFVYGEVTKTRISKNKAKYDLKAIIKNEDGTEQIQEVNDITKDTSEMEDLITRQVSMELRHGIPVEYVVHQLEKSGDIGSFNKAIMRAMKKYIKNNSVSSLNYCPKCEEKGEKNKMVYMEGCLYCEVCKYSPKCS